VWQNGKVSHIDPFINSSSVKPVITRPIYWCIQIIIYNSGGCIKYFRVLTDDLTLNDQRICHVLPHNTFNYGRIESVVPSREYLVTLSDMRQKNQWCILANISSNWCQWNITECYIVRVARIEECSIFPVTQSCTSSSLVMDIEPMRMTVWIQFHLEVIII